MDRRPGRDTLRPPPPPPARTAPAAPAAAQHRPRARREPRADKPGERRETGRPDGSGARSGETGTGALDPWPPHAPPRTAGPMTPSGCNLVRLAVGHRAPTRSSKWASVHSSPTTRLVRTRPSRQAGSVWAGLSSQAERSIQISSRLAFERAKSPSSCPLYGVARRHLTSWWDIVSALA